MQLENLQNDPVLLLQNALEHLSKRQSLRLLCYTKGRRRKGQHLLQLGFPEGPHTCLKAPAAVCTSPTLMGFSMFIGYSDMFPAQGHSCVSSLHFL